MTIVLTAGAALLGVLALVVLAGRLLQAGGWSSRPTSGSARLGLARWLPQLAPRPRPAALLAIEDTIALDPRRRLHVVRCGPRQVLLLTGGAQDVVVGWLPEA